MVEIHFKDNEKMELRDAVCSALVGSPGFINNEIMVSDGDDHDFYLIIGNSNSKDIFLKGEKKT